MPKGWGGGVRGEERRAEEKVEVALVARAKKISRGVKDR